MNITQLTYFKYAVDEMSITKAAQRLFVTQSAVSQQIALLAEELECQLFYRKGRSLQLTPDGEFIYQKAKTIISQMETLADELKSRGENVVGTVKIGSGPVVSKKLLPDIISNVMSSYPDVSFSVFEINSYDLVKSIVQSKIDLGVGQINEYDDRIDVEKLLSGRVVLICPAQSDWSARKSVSLRELSKVSLIRRLREVEHSQIDKLLKNKQVEQKFQLEVINTETIVPYVQRGMGMALAPDYVIDLMAPEGVTKVELEEEIPISWGILKDKYSPVSKAAMVFIDSLKQQLKHSPLNDK